MTTEITERTNRLFLVVAVWIFLLLASLCQCGCASVPQETIYYIQQPVAIVVCNDAAFGQHCRRMGREPSEYEGLHCGRIIYIRKAHWDTDWTAHEFKHLPEIEGKYHLEYLRNSPR